MRSSIMVRCTALLMASNLASGAWAGDVTRFELKEEFHGYPCFLTLQTTDDPELTIQLSDYKDVWSLNFFVSHNPTAIKRLGTKNNIVNRDELLTNVPSVHLDDRSFPFHEANLFAAGSAPFDDSTPAIFELREKHNVAALLSQKDVQSISLPGLFEASNAHDALAQFRSCSMNAMGIKEGGKVDYDARAEYRMIFEKSFDEWIKSLAREEYCTLKSLDDARVDAIIQKATDAFYPGVRNFMKRRAYANDLSEKLPILKLGGMADGKANGCFMASETVTISAIPVQMAIEKAENMD